MKCESCNQRKVFIKGIKLFKCQKCNKETINTVGDVDICQECCEKHNICDVCGKEIKLKLKDRINIIKNKGELRGKTIKDIMTRWDGSLYIAFDDNSITSMKHDYYDECEYIEIDTSAITDSLPESSSRISYYIGRFNSNSDNNTPTRFMIRNGIITKDMLEDEFKILKEQEDIEKAKIEEIGFQKEYEQYLILKEKFEK